MTDITNSILALDPNAEVSVNAEDVNQITWHDGNPNNITVTQIQTKQAELQEEYDAQEYARNREAEYPPLNDLIVALWEGVVEERMASVMELEVQRQAVKAKYPKGE